jgi:hypothetical protein
MQPGCPQEQSISGFFTIASHCKLQYLPEAARHEQTRCAHFSAFMVVISILLSSIWTDSAGAFGRNRCANSV